MKLDKGLLSGSTTTLILKLLEEQDMYGYQMIDMLSKRSDHTFDLKAGTLYPILHTLEKNGCVISYEQQSENERTRKYYHLTTKGAKMLDEKQKEWHIYSSAVDKVLKGGLTYGSI